MATRYQFINKTKYDQAPAYIQQLYPSVVLASNDYYIDVSINDRLDLLAQDFYGDSKLWWVIAMANDLPGDSVFPPLGFQLRIPNNANRALDEFESLNTNR